MRNRSFLLVGFALIGAAIIVRLISTGDAPSSWDVAILRHVAGWRTSLLSMMFANITALGSLTLITLHTIIAIGILSSIGNRRAALQVGLASGVAWISTQVVKAILETPRPTLVAALTEATGFSFPSGHAFTASAMYVTIAFVACRYFSGTRQRRLLAGFTALIITGVAISRVYLGVHYPSDILSGVLLGAGWAVILESRFTDASSSYAVRHSR